MEIKKFQLFINGELKAETTEEAVCDKYYEIATDILKTFGIKYQRASLFDGNTLKVNLVYDK